MSSESFVQFVNDLNMLMESIVDTCDEAQDQALDQGLDPILDQDQDIHPSQDLHQYSQDNLNQGSNKDVKQELNQKSKKSTKKSCLCFDINKITRDSSSSFINDIKSRYQDKKHDLDQDQDQYNQNKAIASCLDFVSRSFWQIWLQNRGIRIVHASGRI
jgi:hypothetical protein